MGLIKTTKGLSPGVPNAGLNIQVKDASTRFLTLHAEQGIDKRTLIGRKSYDYGA
jgi:hypothetical protein